MSLDSEVAARSADFLILVLADLEFLLRTLSAGIHVVLTEYFPAVDDGVVTDGEYEVPRRSLTGPSAFGESQEGSSKSTLERPPGSVFGGA